MMHERSQLRVPEQVGPDPQPQESPDAQPGVFFCPELQTKMITDLPHEEYMSSRYRVARVVAILSIGTNT